MAMHIDLALEAVDSSKASLPAGVTREEAEENGVPITRIVVKTQAGADAIGKPPGSYTTVEVAPFHRAALDFEAEAQTIGNEIARMLPKGEVLVVGLGNAAITPDALGPEAVRLIFTTRHLHETLSKIEGMGNLRKVSAIAPGVLGQTGIESAEIIRSLVRETKPAAVIAIDALASRELRRLGATVQIADTGIAPGSGVENHRRALDEQTLGVPVIAVGVPTVVDVRTLAADVFGGAPPKETSQKEQHQMLVTPREIDSVIQNAAKAVAFGINLALQPELSLADMIALVS